MGTFINGNFFDIFGEDGNLTNRNMNVDGSTTPVDFLVAPQDRYEYLVFRLMMKIRDGAGFRAERFGGIAELTNGLQLLIHAGANNPRYDEGEEVIFTEEPIKNNADIGLYCFDVDLKTWGSGDSFLLARWSFERAGEPIKLYAGDSLRVRVRDDLTALTNVAFMAQGQRDRIPSSS